jgi:ABC-type transport system involved in cytochrome c biogenesis permease subunit
VDGLLIALATSTHFAAMIYYRKTLFGYEPKLTVFHLLAVVLLIISIPHALPNKVFQSKSSLRIIILK